MDVLLVLIGLTVAGALSLLTHAIYREHRRAQRLVSARLIGLNGAFARTPQAVLRDSERWSGLIRFLPLSRSAAERTRSDLARAGSSLSVGRYLAARLATALAGGAAAFLLIHSLGIGSTPARLATLSGLVALGWLLPRVYLAYRRRRRINQIAGEVGDALTAISKALRVGQGIMQALSHAAEETAEPLGGELKTLFRDLQLGADAETAFADLSTRVGSADLDIAITAIVIQRGAGGNLSQILDGVARTIRERAKLNNEVRVLTSRQRLTANLVAAMPIVIAVAFIALNPKLGGLLFTTTAGQISAGVGVAFEVMGILIIRQLSKIEV